MTGDTYGRSQAEWDQLARNGLAFLVERARLGRPTSYTEFNSILARRTGQREFDFERADERAAMGHLLGLIVDLNRPDTGLMISALVNYLDENDAGARLLQLRPAAGNAPPGRHERREVGVLGWPGHSALPLL